MRKSFYDFLMLKEATTGDNQDGHKGISSEVKLGDDGPYKPFNVGDENHPNLKVIVQAFLDSQKVPFPGPDGYPQKLTTLDAKGESTPKLKKKQLYLVGGAVRDHLLGKTPKDYDLATDATPDEIRLILRAAGFTETKPQTGKHAPVDKRYEKYQDAGTKNKIFYAKGWDRAGREFVMGARVNGEEFEIATFRKDSKASDGRTPDRMEFTPSLEDDSARRDFTINAMAIPLTSADGPNAKLIDPHGGAHHLRSGEVRFVGDARERLQEDQLRALRYIRFVSRFNSNAAIPPEYKEAIQEIRDLGAVSRERIRDEFVKGLEHPDVDTKKYIKMYKELGLLQTVFPGMSFKLDDDRKDYTDKKDKRLAVAWILRMNNPDDIKEMLAHGTWSNSEINDIIHLIKMNGWAGKYGKDDDGFYNDFYDMKTNLHQRTSLVPSIIRQWGQMNNHDEEMLAHYIGHELGTKGYVKDSFGNRTVNPELTKMFGGKTPEGPQFGQGIRQIETEKFRNRFSKNRQKDSGGGEPAQS
jgi:tRNA nucleotidyltransferase/poly(A) polymerase